MYADSDYFGHFNRIVMTYIQVSFIYPYTFHSFDDICATQVQTDLSLYENDFRKGLRMVDKWDTWMDK